LPGNTVINRSFDALQRTKTISVSTFGGQQLLTRDYTYSAVGEILTKQTEHGTYTYTYDAVSRLTNADNPNIPDEPFTYDKLSNRLAAAIANGNMVYDLNNELINVGGTTITHDANGSMVNNPAEAEPHKFFYDVTHRLKRIENESSVELASYYYDPFGRRLWKEVDGVTTYYLYSDEGLIGEYDQNGAEIKTYGYLPGTDWSTNPLFQQSHGSYFWYLNDHLGTPQKMVDSTGTVVWAARFDSFGNAQVDVNLQTNNLGFAGQYYDQESGLYYNYHRYYDPLLGRYLRKDPLGLDAGINFYVYVENNPLIVVDPEGLMGRAAYNATTEAVGSVIDWTTE
jgi:RHS repeat-associated protein